MICSSAFWKQKCENLKKVSPTFFKFQSIPTYSVSGQRHSLRASFPGGGGGGQFYCTGVIIYNKTRQFFFVSVHRQTFLGFEISFGKLTANTDNTAQQASVIQRADDFIKWINRYPVDKMYSN